jgi:glyoxylase-like metal-dependent hydrolase (beta-lactamase superfamily II)
MNLRSLQAVLAFALLHLAAPLAAQSPAPIIVHLHAAGEGGIFANAYLVETARGVVAIDSGLTESESKALHAKLDALGKPLLAVLLTHGHPDHYNGVTNLVGASGAPIVATAGVDAVIRRDDAAKEKQWRPVFKDEWPKERTFPNRLLRDGESLELDGARFTVHDLGPGESHRDSIWIVESGPAKLAFIGDVVLQGSHAYLSDGHSTRWLRNLGRVKRLAAGAERVYPGHGDAGGMELLDWQRAYLTAYRDNIAALARGRPSLGDADKDELERRMVARYGAERLRFLIKLGADPVARELAQAKSAKP